MQGSKKRLAHLFALSLSTTIAVCNTQTTASNEIIGLWQEDTPVIGAGYGNCFRFFKNSTFEFTFSRFDATRRIVSIHGDFKRQKDLFTLSVKFRKEYVGGLIVRDPISSGGWGLENARLVTIKQDSGTNEQLQIKTTPMASASLKWIEIDGVKYHRVSNNPNSR